MTSAPSRRRRATILRRRVATLAVSLFIAVWALICVRLTTGHDPVLAATVAQRRTATSSTSAPASSTGSQDSSTSAQESSTSAQDSSTSAQDDSSTGSLSSASSGSGSVAAVTTSQS
ncbi:MAG TPA: hypothetical protein VHX88_04960 [Solirubrobacteraceae bacterium]|nr:hypothetical protein [Solirubrobacteraceae bacterium]